MATPPTPAPPDAVYPLSMFRLARGLPPLRHEVIDGSEIPQPYSDLLVHQDDMTMRLEDFSGGPIRVRRLNSSNDGRAYFRELVLETAGGGKPVEYGAIEISLTNLPVEIREGGTRRPWIPSCRQTAFRGGVTEMKVSMIAKKFIGRGSTCKKHIRPSVTIDVCNGYASARKP